MEKYVDNKKEAIRIAFIVFLKYNGVFQRYVQEIKIPSRKLWLDYINVQFNSFIEVMPENLFSAFSWGCTMEGYYFWFDIDRKWLQILKEINNHTNFNTKEIVKWVQEHSV